METCSGKNGHPTECLEAAVTSQSALFPSIFAAGYNVIGSQSRLLRLFILNGGVICLVYFTFFSEAI